VFGGSFRILHFAVRPRVLFRYLGQILLILAGLTAVPAVASMLSGRSDIALRYAAVMLVMGVFGGLGTRLRCTDRMQPNEALVISTLVFLLSGLAMSFPLMGYGIAPLDAVFEALSGVTTTGLSTLATVEGRPRAFLFARAWLQWVGGLGVVVLALAFTIQSSVASKHLGFGEREAADFVGGTRGHARRILRVYVTLTLLGFALCFASGMDWFNALTHVLAAVSTGGFSTVDASLAPLTPAARTAVTVVCLTGAVSFALYYRGSLAWALRDSRLWTLFALIAASTAFLALTIAWADPHASPQALRQAAWMAVSAQTTAGFSTLPVGELPAAGKLVLIASMLVGGEVGSTAGGLKVLRFLILGQMVVARVLRTSMPRASHLSLRVDGTRVGNSEIEAAAALALVYAATIFVSWLAFVVHGYAPLDALFDVVSALGTVGLSAGTVRPDLEPLLKGVLCLDMLMGRVELFAFLVFIFPGTWIGRRRSSL